MGMDWRNLAMKLRPGRSPVQIRFGRLAYIHVPKSAGTSIIDALNHSLKPRCAVGGFDRSMFGGFDDFQSLGEPAARHVFLHAGALPARADLIAGHFALSTIQQRYPDAAVLMILREPQSRLLSHWTFWRSEAETPQPAWGTWTQRLTAAHGGFGDFLTDKRIACQTDNVALRLLLWPHPLLPADGFIAPEHDAALLAAASARLAEVAHLNVSENPALASDLAAWLGRPFAMRRIKETLPVAPRYSVMLAEQLTQTTQDAWQSRTRLDMALWRMACAAVMPDADIAALTATVRDLSVARYAKLLNRAA